MGKDITKRRLRVFWRVKNRRSRRVCLVKLPMELYERYFAQMDARAVQEIVEKALEGYFGKEAAGV